MAQAETHLEMRVKHEEGVARTADGLRLMTYLWEPSYGPVRAAVCLVHGLGEHASRYGRLAEALATEGYALAALDLRGHGRSEGRRGDAPSYGLLLDDVHRLLDVAGERWPDAPRVLYGHSMGGNIVLNHLLRGDEACVRGAVVASPWLRLALSPPRWKLALAEVVGRLYPGLMQRSGLKGSDMSHDDQWVVAAREDPLNHSLVSVRLYIMLRDAGEYVLANAALLRTPVLLMHGGSDAVTSAEASREFARAAGDACTFRLWEGLYHELHNEPQRREVYRAVLDWLDARTSAPSTP